MASIFKKTVTRPLPADAELFVRKGQEFARWKTKNGKPRTERVTTGRDGQKRIVTEAGTYTAKYRDGSGLLQEAATGCRDKAAAQSVLNELVKRAERVRGNLITAADAAAIDHQHTPLAEAVGDYLDYLRAKGRSAQHIADCERLALRAFAECGFDRLRDIAGEPLERWLTKLMDEGRSPRTRNSYLQAVRGFCRWCVSSGRLTSEPTKRIGKLNESTDKRKQRRALHADELGRLLYVAMWRPLAEYGRERIPNRTPKGRATWKLAPLAIDNLDDALARARATLAENAEFVTQLEQRGRQRALIYKTLVLTGLRRGELASLAVGSLVTDTMTPYLVLEAGDAKNRQRAELPLRRDLAADLMEWIADKQRAHSEQSGAAGDVLSMDTARRATLPIDTPLFQVPDQLVKTMDRDLAAAGIEKVDERGRSIDVHALRHSYGSLLSAGGVAPRTAQAAMRHSSIDLTMNVYTDPRVLDVAAAMESLPALPLHADPTQANRQKATGTDGGEKLVARTVAPVVAPKSGNRSKSVATTDNWEEKAVCVEGLLEPRKTVVLRESLRVAEGNRTLDLRNHNPTL